MATQKQIIANRQNATHSTGPKTEEGKVVITHNALKHGIFSKQVVLKSESKKDFDLLKMEFYDHFRPQGFLEQLFCDRALAAAWRLSRITQMESMLINASTQASFFDKEITEVLSGYQGDKLTLLSRYESSLERVFFRALGEIKSLQTTRACNKEIDIGFVS